LVTVLEALTTGLDHQRAGRRTAAEAIYREILRQAPGNADAWHLLGLLAHEAGEEETALKLVNRALALQPHTALFHNSSGMILHAAGRLEEARPAFETALVHDPRLPQAHSNFGNLLQDLGSPAEAIPHYARALESLPDTPEIHNNLGNAHLALGQPEAAVSSFRAALERQPGYAEALANLGGALERLERVEEAEACCREALRLRPGLAEAWCNLGNLRHLQKRFAEAGECCRKALRYRPRHPESWNNLGNALRQQDRFEEALQCYREALRLRPQWADAQANLGAALNDQGRFQEALACYEEALRINPRHPDARLNRALLLLLLGHMEDGWREYEWRWEQREIQPRPLAQPAWDGSPLNGRTLLVTAEQGLGDAIQFIRYLPLIERKGSRVLLECPARLAPLLGNLPGADAVIASGRELPAFDVQAPLLSLPRLLGNARVPDPPRLLPDPRAVRDWGRRLPPDGTMRIGLCWTGNPDQANNRKRSVPVESLRALSEAGGVTWFSLQKGAEAPPGWLRQIEDPSGTLSDTAALIMHLDLVISVDTMIAHLAGALGKPVWILLPFVPDWRWLLKRHDSPWYPSARLFRQDGWGNWASVVQSVGRALAAEAGKHCPSRPDQTDDGGESTPFPTRCRETQNQNRM
jgi:tetratricopeptide (TPR) repeat protein